MKIVLLIISSLVLGILVLGWSLPKVHVAQKTVTFPYPRSLVWAKMRDLSGQVQWRPDVEKIEILNSTSGKEEWVEFPKQGAKLYFRTVAITEQERWEMETFDSPVLVHWTGILTDTKEGGTEVFFEEQATVSNPVFRIFAFLFIDLNKLIEEYSLNLQNALQGGSR